MNYTERKPISEPHAKSWQMANCSGCGGEWHVAECALAMWYASGLRLADRFASVIYRQYLCD